MKVHEVIKSLQTKDQDLELVICHEGIYYDLEDNYIELAYVVDGILDDIEPGNCLALRTLT